ncbi:phage tail assembly protein [Ochrobactrum sp. MR28]|nr:phage tail assembly protein [Ochrobactrum sp. MR28]MBX8818996.1 phage tail assembly protein [Ochrobactrum sp. MR31]
MSNVSTVTVPLKKPVVHDGVTYNELTFREAKVGDMMAADHFSGQFSQTMAVLASISNTPMPAFKEIGAPDLKVIMKETKHLVGND